MNTINLLLKPAITEKATSHEKDGKYIFFVRKDATKIAIKNAFRMVYGIPAIKVNVINTPGKVKPGRKGPMTKKAVMKKVIITVKDKKGLDISKPKLK